MRNQCTGVAMTHLVRLPEVGNLFHMLQVLKRVRHLEPVRKRFSILLSIEAQLAAGPLMPCSFAISTVPAAR